MATTTNYGWTTPNDTDLVKNGASAIRTLGSAVDSSLWTAGYSAGKNKIINGDFGIWQRGTSISLTNNTTAYTTDRWYIYTSFSAGSSTVSRQTFTPATAPVSGYEGEYFARYTAGSTATYFEFGQRIEDVRVFANQTATLSFWAKASANTTVSSTLLQNFGSGGSTQVSVTGASHSVTTSWTRFNVTISVPSISGKTIGTSSYLALTLAANSLTGSQTIDIWGVQVEAGATATPFQTATGTKQGELAACQRYYYRFAATSTNQYFGSAYARSSTNAFALVKQPVTMRTAPSLAFASGSSYFNFQIGSGDFAVTTLDGTYYATTDTALVRMTSSGMTTGQGGMAQFNNASAYIEMSSEL